MPSRKPAFEPARVQDDLYTSTVPETNPVPETGTEELTVEQQTLALLKTMYPAGIVTDMALWESLAQEYGLATLYAWGLHEPVEGNQAGETKFRPIAMDTTRLVK